MNVKYQIFVSSTYDDLKDERNEVIKACLNMGHIPVGMEMFNAADEEQWAVISRTIDQCDYYVVVIAHRYGSTTPERISFTEKEYDYAVAQGVPVLSFILAEDAPWPNTKKDEQPDPLEALKRFKAKVKQKMVRFWKSAPELRSQFVESLATTINVKPRRGWAQAPGTTDTDIAQALSNLTEENARLRKEITDNKQRFGLRDRIDDIVDVISKEVFELADNRHINGSELVLELISYIRQNDDHVLDVEIHQYLSDFDSEKISDFLHQLVILNVIRKSSAAYTTSEISGDIYAKLVLRS